METSEAISLPVGQLDVRVLAVINELLLRYRDCHEGEVANYIPELAKVDPNVFGIAVATTDGEVFAVGDTGTRFTLQSIANPFVYGMAIDALGRDDVRQTVGVEPTGNPFNAIILEPFSNRPMNPMVNAGAIAVASMIPGIGPTERLNRILAMFGNYMGSTPSVNMEVFMSERSTGHRNRSIAYLMKNFNVLRSTVDETLDLYFQACSVEVTCVQLALMAATLANGGKQPQTDVQAITQSSLRDVLSIMFSCGLYESSGQWVHSVGIPAKSGVGGGLMAVVPGRLGLAVCSPRLDQAGNSVRGKLVARDLAEMLGLHLFHSSPSEV